MFNQKRVEVNIGDVFVEYFHNKRKILSMMGLSKDFEISNFQNLWTVVRINYFSGYPHAELHGKTGKLQKILSGAFRYGCLKLHRFSLTSIASQMSLATSGPPKFAISRIQVGDVTLISVR
jgi:hypothetical protein